MDSLIKFSRHEPCPKCRERGKDKAGDNLARYVNGKGFCFSCGYRENSQQTATQIHQKMVEITPEPPKDLSRTIPAANWTWLSQYLTPEQINKNFWYSEKMQRHVFRHLSFYEARSVTGAEPKSYSVGEKPSIVFSKEDLPQDTLVLVEDVVSAIKLGELIPAFPLFGSGPSVSQRDFLRTSGFSNIIIWLDRDKYTRSLWMRKYLTGLGKNARVISTTKDPKDYTLEQLSSVLEGEYADETSFDA